MEEKQLTSYLEVLKDMRNGKTILELSERLSDVITAVQSTGKQGSVTLKLALRPAHRGEDIDQFLITETITHSLPEKDTPDTLFIVNHEGVLQSFASRQIQMELRDVEAQVRKDILKEAK